VILLLKHTTDINNVGSISQALFAKGNPDFDDRKAAQWQATQVSAVSIMNCVGRLLIGRSAADICAVSQ
jgi:hypothetical protein